MIYIFQVKSEESDTFLLSLQIDSEATFYDLHQLIVEACGYEDGQMASFFTLNSKGQRIEEISLMELSSEKEEVNISVMDVSVLREFITYDVKKIEYLYDFFGDRYFTILLEEVRNGVQEKGVLLLKKGDIPTQTSLEGFADIELGMNPSKKRAIDYEKYLSSFDDCNDDTVSFQSFDELDKEI